MGTSSAEMEDTENETKQKNNQTKTEKQKPPQTQEATDKTLKTTTTFHRLAGDNTHTDKCRGNNKSFGD